MNKATDEPRDHFVYRFLGSDHQLLYVGCTKRPELRWKEHRSQRPHMTARVVRIKMTGPLTRTAARYLERQALLTEDPEFGFTPAKQSERVIRNAWIDRRTAQLVKHGMDYFQAASMAVREAEDQFPDPMENEYGSTSLRTRSNETAASRRNC